MPTVRALALIVVVFVVSMPVMYFINHGLPAQWDLPVDLADEAREEKDDPAVDAFCLKGLMLLGDEQYDKAIDAYSKAINRDPKYSFAYLGRGDAYLAKGDLDRALVDYDHAVRLDPENDAAKARAHVVREQRARQ